MYVHHPRPSWLPAIIFATFTIIGITADMSAWMLGGCVTLFLLSLGLQIYHVLHRHKDRKNAQSGVSV